MIKRDSELSSYNYLKSGFFSEKNVHQKTYLFSISSTSVSQPFGLQVPVEDKFWLHCPGHIKKKF